MNVTRKFVEPDQLTDVVCAAFGSTLRLNTITRLRGGSKKGVYRLIFDNNSSAILYVWDAAENYWPQQQDGAGSGWANPFSDASGIDLFEASQACLKTIGVRTPQVYLLDRGRRYFPADLAVVEDVQGGTLESQIRNYPQGAEQTLVRLASTLQIMRRHTGRRLGKVVLKDLSSFPQDRSCEQIVLDRAVLHLAEAASRIERVAQVHKQLEAKIRELAGVVRPRNEYSLIHGELGPDHVLVDEQGNPVLIDIEGTMFFDIEWEHVFLQLRFGEHYQWLKTNDLDSQRMQFYALAMHLSLIAGPLRLLDGDFPEREFMMGIADYNTQRALTFLY